MYGEPWTANDGENGISGEDCCNKANAKKLSSRIGMFNDDMRHGIKGGSDDDSKGFIQGSTHSAYNVIAGMMGASSVTFGNWANEPSQCVTYASAHDNLTLWDKILKCRSMISPGRVGMSSPDADKVAGNHASLHLLARRYALPLAPR